MADKDLGSNVYVLPQLPKNSIDISVYSPPFCGLYQFPGSGKLVFYINEFNAILCQVILHIREVEGNKANLMLKGPDSKPLDLIQVDVLGHDVAKASFEIGPWESRFYKVTW